MSENKRLIKQVHYFTKPQVFRSNVKIYFINKGNRYGKYIKRTHKVNFKLFRK